MIETIILDIGETVLVGMLGVEPRVATAFNVREEDVLGKCLVGDKLRTLFEGRISEDEYWSRVIQENGFPGNLEQYGSSLEYLKRVMRENFTEVPGMLQLVSDIKNSNAVQSLALLSDHVREWVDYCESQFSFRSLFDKEYFSFDTGLRKTSPEVYLHVLGDLDADPETTLFVDDRERSLNVARSPPVNIKYLHQFTGVDHLRQELENYCLLGHSESDLSL